MCTKVDSNLTNLRKLYAPSFGASVIHENPNPKCAPSLIR